VGVSGKAKIEWSRADIGRQFVEIAWRVLHYHRSAALEGGVEESHVWLSGSEIIQARDVKSTQPNPIGSHLIHQERYPVVSVLVAQRRKIDVRPVFPITQNSNGGHATQSRKKGMKSRKPILPVNDIARENDQIGFKGFDSVGDFRLTATEVLNVQVRELNDPDAVPCLVRAHIVDADVHPVRLDPYGIPTEQSHQPSERDPQAHGDHILQRIGVVCFALVSLAVRLLVTPSSSLSMARMIIPRPSLAADAAGDLQQQRSIKPLRRNRRTATPQARLGELRRHPLRRGIDHRPDRTQQVIRRNRHLRRDVAVDLDWISSPPLIVSQFG
jgi:hypothetical protein